MIRNDTYITYINMTLKIIEPHLIIHKIVFRTYDYDNAYTVKLDHQIKGGISIPHAYEIIEEERLDRISQLQVNDKPMDWIELKRLAWKMEGERYKMKAIQVGQELAQSSFNQLNR